MPSIDRGIDNLIDRLSNRAIWQMAPRWRTIETEVPLVSFTFDDVPHTALHHGATILEKYDLHGTFYIAGGLAGRVEEDRTLISPEDCHALWQRGHEIGCHTYSHDRVRALTGELLAQDLDRNADYL